MSGRLTTEQLEAIRSRTEKATEGPWNWTEDGKNLISEKGGTIVGEAVYDGIGGVWFDAWRRDEEFIAHSREDIPALLAEVESLNAEIADRERSHIENYGEYRAVKSEVERLRGNLRTIEVMTTCANTKDFARRALSGDATIEI